MADTTTSDEVSSGCSLVLKAFECAALGECARGLEPEFADAALEGSPASPSGTFLASPKSDPLADSPREDQRTDRQDAMQEQQQQHLRAMLGTSGQLAYYGLRLAPPPHVTTNTVSGGICSTTFGGMRAPNAVPSVRPALYLPMHAYQHPSSTVSSVTAAAVSTATAAAPSTPTTSNTHCRVASSTSSSVDSSTPKSPKANKSESKASAGIQEGRGGHGQEEGTGHPQEDGGGRSQEGGGIQSQDGRGTSAPEGGAGGRSQEGGGIRKSPPPPSRMVTRSQTAAGRTTINLEVEERVSNVRAKGHKRARSCSSEREVVSPRKVCREPTASASVGFDDFAFSKNPAGAGIEFGAVCTDCGAVAVTGAGWTAHQAAHRGEGAACSFCTQVFLSSHGRDAHQQLHREGHTRDVDDYCECGLCGGSFIAVMYLELHLLELHGRDALYDPRSLHLGPTTSAEPTCPPEDESGRQLFRCGVCHSLFTFSLNLDCHMALHSDVSYGCALCDALFPALDPLVTHSKAHRFAGIAPPPAPGMAVHASSPQVPPRRHAPPQRHVLPPTAPAPMNVWGAQPMRAAHHPSTVPAAQPMTSPIGVPMNPTMNPTMTPTINPSMNPAMNPAMTSAMNPAMNSAMNSAMTPAMLNYCMMMSLWGGDKTPATSETSVWPNYFNPAMANVFNYFNPYLLNNNNNNNSTPNNNNPSNGSKGSLGGGMRKDGIEAATGALGREDAAVDGSA
ncbi:uncharacterized protein [Penaeus vannamei]|uniref:uncharacterized protein isoform X1 n=2 Tax=Penaeus vannamei TaxID=6689 RepID=UPI00387F41AC